MALTNEEKQELLNAMKAESQGVDELEQVDTLDGIMSLPALRGEEVVSAPIKLLTKPAEDAVANAVSAANRATEAAQAVYSVTNAVILNPKSSVFLPPQNTLYFFLIELCNIVIIAVHHRQLTNRSHLVLTRRLLSARRQRQEHQHRSAD